LISLIALMVASLQLSSHQVKSYKKFAAPVTFYDRSLADGQSHE
jgi:hypothetical protein